MVLLRFASFLLILASLVFIGAIATSADETFSITVSAGAFDRENSIVSVVLPYEVSAGAYALSSEGGQSTVLQVDHSGIAWFIVDQLSAGESKTYRMEGQPSASNPGAAYSRTGPAISFSVEGNEVLSYFAEESPLPDGVDPIYERGGYIHPVHTPAGIVVTGDFPEDHVHHHGIWAAWTNTEFEGRTPDFWNMGQGKGKVEVEALDLTWDGPIHTGLVARHNYVDLEAGEPLTALNEQWEVRVYHVPGAIGRFHIFDLDVTHSVNTGSPLFLPEYRYGGVGFRGHDAWNGAENTFFLTSEGRDRTDGHGTRARWCHIGGYVDGELAGIAILGHPENFRAPQHMRIHPDEPFFNYAPVQAGDMSIEPGRPYFARYRYVTYDGEPDVDQLERLWNDYAYPPGVTVSR